MSEVATSDDDPIAPVDASSSWFVRWRYWILGGLVLLAVASQTRNQQWTTDMWMHAATVREFATHPFDPGDPVISAMHDSAWLNPYTWAVGRLAALFDDNTLDRAVDRRGGERRARARGVPGLRDRADEQPTRTVLRAARRAAPVGPTCLAVERGDPRRRHRLRRAVPLDARLGADVVRAHDRQPSGALGRRARRLVATRRAGRGRALVALVHPPTGVVLAVVGPVLVLCRLRPWSWSTLGWIALPVAVGIGVAALWPFFPLFDLSPGGFYKASDELFYQSVPQRIFPALLGLVVVYRRTRADWRDPMAWLVGAALVLYGIGYWGGIGRPIIFAVLVLQIAVGDGLGRIEAAWSARVGVPHGSSCTRWRAP